MNNIKRLITIILISVFLLNPIFTGMTYADEATISESVSSTETTATPSGDAVEAIQESPQDNTNTTIEESTIITNDPTDQTTINPDEIQENPQQMNQTISTGGGGENGPDNSVKTDPLGANKYLKNNLRVGEFTGAAIYDYPLNLPSGRNGMTPSIALTYNSQDSALENIAGYRWNINMYSIKRFNKNGTEKMYNQTDFIANTPIENGEIISTKLTSGQYGKYAQKVENNFSAYTYNSDGSWIMYDKAGTKYTFGKNTTAKQADPADSTKIYQWMLEEIRDTNDNFIRYTYTQDKNQIYPKSIYYTGSGSTDGIFEVRFNKTTSVRTDKNYSYSRAFRVDTEHLINSIDIYSSSKLRRKYNVNYTTVNPLIKQTISQITETGYDTSGLSKSLPPVKFDYTKSDVKWQESTDYKPNWFITECHNYTGNPSGGSCESGPKHIVSWDMNGDGLEDFEYREEILSSYRDIQAMNDGKGGWKYTFYEPSQGYTSNLDIPNMSKKAVDYDGDARNDIVQSYLGYDYGNGSPVLSKITLKNSGKEHYNTIAIPMQSTGAHKLDNGASIADLNGDGLPDIIQGRRSQGHKFGAYAKNTCLNIDGTSCTTTNLWQIPVPIIEDTQYDQNPRKVYVQDCNGDGLADIFSSDKYINDGKGNFIKETVSGNFNNGSSKDVCSFTTMDQNIRRSADFNGDGLIDKIEAYKTLKPGNATGWFEANNLTIKTGGSTDIVYNNLFPMMLGWVDSSGLDAGVSIVDLNGDLLPDIMHSLKDNSNKITKKIYMNKGSRPYFLKTVTNEQGGKINLEYKTSAQYIKKDGTQANPNLPIIITTVNKITSDDGFGNKSATDYFYEDGHYYYDSPDDREMAGFRIVTKTDAKGNITKNYYHQDEKSIADVTNGENDDHISKKGLVYRTEVYDNSNNLIRLVLNKWTKASKPDVDADDDRWLVALKRTTNLDYGENKQFMAKAVAYTYDGYGNIKEITDYGTITGVNSRGDFQDSGTDKITTTTAYAYNTAKSILGAPVTTEKKDYNNNLIGKSNTYYDGLALGQVSKGNATKNESYYSATGFATAKQTYNNYGLVTDVTNPRGYKSTIVYDSFNLYPATTTNAKSHSAKYEYDYALGATTKVTDANNAVAETIFDALGRTTEVKIKNPSGQMKTVKKYSYDLVNSPISVTENIYPNNKDNLNKDIEITKKTYLDGFGRTIQTKTEAEGVGKYNVASIIYNELGNVKKEYLPKSSTTINFEAITTSDYGNEYTYDALGRVKTIKNSLGTTKFDYHNWWKRITDADGKPTQYYYDARGNLTQVNEKLDGKLYPTYYTYNSNNNLIKITDAEGKVKEMTYDYWGNTLTQELLHTAGASGIKKYTYTYNENGNIQTAKDPKNQLITYTYDELDRTTKEDTGVAGEATVYVYDTATNGKGKITSVAFKGGSKSYNYDLLGNIIDETKKIDGKTWKTSYQYDLLGSVLKITYPDNTAVTYKYNNADQIKLVPSYVKKFYYNPIGAVSHAYFINGVITTNTYDAAQMYRLKRIRTYLGTANLQNIWYKYDAVGNITTLQDFSTTNASKIANYTYDDLHRLTKAQITSTKNNQDYTRTYTYGITGNILSKSDVGSYDYLGWHPHAVTKAGTKSYTYDDNGSLTSDETWTHTYDTRGRLVKSEKGEIKGKILLFNMDDGQGAKSFADSSGSKGSVPCIGQKCPVWQTAKFGGDYEFDGVDDYLAVPDNSNLNFTSEYTLSAWVNPDAINTYGPIFTRGSATGDDIEVYLRKDGLILAHNRTNGGKFSYTLNGNLPNNPPLNKWSHFVITWSNNKWKVYVNDVLEYTSITKENPKNTGKWMIGKSLSKAFGTNNAFDGKVNDIAIFDKSLTDVEVSSMYTQSRNSGTCSGTSCPTYIDSAKFGGGYDFDGIDDAIEIPSDTSLNFTSEYTLSAWVNPDVIKSYAPLFVRKSETGDDIEVYITTAGLYLVHNRTNGGKFSYLTKWDNPPIGKWTHLTVTWKENKWKLYLNGVLKQASQAKENPISTGKWFIGKSTHKAFGTNNAFDGKMDEIAIFNRALSDTEVFDIYKGEGSKVISYSYDEGKERVMKNEDGKKTYYVNNLYEENTKETRKFVYANDLKVASLTKPVGSTVEKQAFHHADHLGGSNVTTDSTGKVIETNDYYPYGDTRVEEKDTSYKNDYMYTGKELDRDTGLYYYGSRYYDPLIGKFTSVDPWGGNIDDPQSLNKYAYVRNNPMKYVDENGECFIMPRDSGMCSEIAKTYRSIGDALNKASEYLGGKGAEGSAFVLSAAAELSNNIGTLHDPDASVPSKSWAGGLVMLDVGTGGGKSTAGKSIGKSISSYGFKKIAQLRKFRELVAKGLNSKTAAAMAKGPKKNVINKTSVSSIQKAENLISGKLKKSKSFHSELRNTTYKEIINLSKGKGPMANKAKQMKKLIEQGQRIINKLK